MQKHNMWNIFSWQYTEIKHWNKRKFLSAFTINLHVINTMNHVNTLVILNNARNRSQLVPKTWQWNCPWAAVITDYVFFTCSIERHP